MFIGKIVKSYSHINYLCQVYGPLEVEAPPHPSDYAFGQFIRVPERSSLPGAPLVRRDTALVKNDEPSCYVVGVIYDTTLLNPTFGSLGPRLFSEAQVELFAPDYLSERAKLVHMIMLGMMRLHRVTGDRRKACIVHGVPPISLELGSSVETMTDEDVRLFHLFSDQEDAENQHEYLHMGYLPLMISQEHSLLPLVMLCLLDRLEHLFPQHFLLLSILKRNFAWRLKVQTIG